MKIPKVVSHLGSPTGPLSVRFTRALVGESFVIGDNLNALAIAVPVSEQYGV